ncbi:hypothetical protein GNF10_00915 [Nostoc sp. UCD121]|uniref:hypothetical protein n=1 Tax=unclassified Nostoc TaxID=2593658 RepID=UPI001628130B|nr:MULTISPECIES: hypothetical protein [unclassified Nostoc]MBC1224950.1 hypothetical protein [Nostoc sp. UCD120]MBC1274576.1 hypothetical protein [Nostoc sp. UCD121]MBC1297086.1 hypothetical protein [Nostoc sp. UCD122]
MAERIESLKAGIVGGFSVGFAFVLFSLLNTFVLAKYFQNLASLHSDINWHLWVSGAFAKLAASCGIAIFSGLLFGVTYRYIIRSDKNPQLKAGGVLSFGLVRGLAQIELGLNSSITIWSFLVIAAESLLWFAFAAIALDLAIKLRWVKPFSSI